MPIYEYRRPDGSTFEVVQSFKDDPLTHDPDTGVPVRRVLHAPAVHFKGSGFYNTDYGTRKRQRENGASSSDESKANGTGGSSDGNSKASGESKAEPAKPSSNGASSAKDAKPATAKS